MLQQWRGRAVYYLYSLLIEPINIQVANYVTVTSKSKINRPPASLLEHCSDQKQDITNSGLMY